MEPHATCWSQRTGAVQVHGHSMPQSVQQFTGSWPNPNPLTLLLTSLHSSEQFPPSMKCLRLSSDFYWCCLSWYLQIHTYTRSASCSFEAHIMYFIQIPTMYFPSLGFFVLTYVLFFFSITNLFLERVFTYLHGERGVSSSIPWFYFPMSPPAAARIERYFQKFVENGIQSFEAGAGSMAPASHLSIGSSPGCSASTRLVLAQRSAGGLLWPPWLHGANQWIPSLALSLCLSN